MTFTAILLLFFAACTHAGWNLLGKRQNPSTGFFLAANLAVALGLSPFIAANHHLLPHIPSEVWGCLVVTGGFQALYFFGLAGAYRHGDLSLAYPIARSSYVVFVALISIILGNGGQIGAGCLLGIALVTGGCIVLPMRTMRDVRLRNYLNISIGMALVAAIGTAGYTLIDDLALRQLRLLPGSPFSFFTGPLLYLGFDAVFTSAWLAVAVLAHGPERRAFPVFIRQGGWLAAVTGWIFAGSYLLALLAMAHVSNISYVAAFRQLSIPIGALLGIVLLGESFHRPKRVGLLLIVSGLTLVVLR